MTLPLRRRGEGAGPEVDYNLVAAILPACPRLAGSTVAVTVNPQG